MACEHPHRIGVQLMDKRSDALDAVRGLAILLVVTFHWFGFGIGWTGVDLFFVLSGYLMGGILIESKHLQSYYLIFYMRRIFRIVPLYFLFLISTWLIFDLDRPIWRYLTFTQNFSWAETGLLNVGLAGLTWSLAIEVQFYLILPFLIRSVTTTVLMRVCVGLIALAPVVRWVLSQTIGEAAPYVLLPGRMDSLFAGVLVATIVRHPVMLGTARQHVRALWLASGVSFAAFVMLGMAASFSPVSLPMYVLGYSLIIMFFGFGLNAVIIQENRPVKHRLLCAIGIGAYSTYLFHRSLQAGALALLGDGLVAALAATALTTAVSAICWFFLERPAIQYARTRWRYNRPNAPATISATPGPAS